MKNIITLVLACCLFAGASYAQKPGQLSSVPCCEIVGINTAKGIITSRSTTTGKVQQFKTSAAGLKNLRMGDRLSVQNGKIIAVNETGYEPINGIVSGNQTGFEPINEMEGEKTDAGHKDVIELEIVSLQVNDISPCCEIVTVKNRTTGQIHSFKTMGGIGRTLTLGQPVTLQNGYAMVQAGATASAAQKGWYAFKAGMDSLTVKQKSVEGNDAEKWVITPSGAKGATGSVSITLPDGLEWHLDIKSSDDKALGKWDDRWNNKKTISLKPGEYNIFFTYIPILGVPVQKGMNTRLKAGILDVVTTGQWQIWNEEKTKVHVVYYKPSKIGLPIGKYNIQLAGQYQAIEIKEGEVTEF